MRDETVAGEGGALPPGTQVAGFTLQERLATGSSGSVYRAERGGRRFALKLVPLGQWGEREVDALRRVRHASVVGLLGYGQWPENEPRFLVLELEWVDGPELDVWARSVPLSARRLAEQVLRPLARALDEVHAAGVVHRDVKEANVLLRREDGHPVLVDFGAAAYEGAPRLTRRLPPGTPEYRSPEMLRFAREWEGEPYPSRPSDDLWALGVMLYALLTRTLPFGDRHGPLVRSILQHEPAPPHVLNPRVPPALGELCLRLLDKELARRCADAPGLTRALEETLADAGAAWDEPLFGTRAPPEDAGPSRPREPPSAPPAEPTTWRGARTLALGAVTALLLLSPRTPGPVAPRDGSPTPRPSSQAGFRQEIAPAPRTAEVGPGAERFQSPPPAPVARATHREDPPMRKSTPGRTPLSATVLTAAACLGTACASVPRPPPPEPCPPGSAETHRRFGLRLEYPYLGTLAPRENFLKPTDSRLITVRDGASVTLETLDEWEWLPDRSRLTGRVHFEPGRVNIRYTQLTLSSGEVLPLCAVLEKSVDMKPGSTSQKAIIHAFVYVTTVDRFR